jgi:S1-C subfamily serine protease
VVVAAILAAGAIGIGIGSQLHDSSSSVAPTSLIKPAASAPSSSKSLPSPNGSAAGATLTLDQVVAKVDPAVVDINTTMTNGRAAGTGMVLTSDGVVLTNNHVIADATDIQVQINGTGTVYKADVLGYDVTDDVALIKLENASHLATVSIGDSSAVSVNDDVVALGNALGKGGTPAVATGVITALDQHITVSDETGGDTETLSGLIEINAGLQPGDSGGPLVNTSGQVIGMDTAASGSSRRSAAADGYAIPIKSALGIAQQIQAGKSSAKVHIGDRALLGVEIRDGQTGATVVGVEDGSPAASAGLTEGDTIVGIDSTKVADSAGLQSALDTHKPGDHVQVSWVDADGASHHAQATLSSGPPA